MPPHELQFGLFAVSVLKDLVMIRGVSMHRGGDQVGANSTGSVSTGSNLQDPEGSAWSLVLRVPSGCPFPPILVSAGTH